MASYQAKIDVIVSGIREAAALEGRLESIQNSLIAIKKTPIDLNLGGRGGLRDLSGKLSREVNDVVRSFVNGEAKFGKSVTSINKQFNTFSDLLSQTAIKGSGTFDKQTVAVKNLASVTAQAYNETVRLNRAQEDLLRTARGLQTVNERDAEVIARRTRVQQGRALQARQREAVSSGVIGGAFPLLFGQGLGASIGGGVGGAAGGFAGGQLGFGLSLVGTALGQSFDQLIQGAQAVGSALRAPIENFKELADAGLFASKGQEKYIQKLIEAGKTAEASALIQAQIVQKIGIQGVKDLQNAGAASEKFNKAVAELGLQMQAAVAGPLAGFLSWLASIVQIGNEVNRNAARQTDIFKGLSQKDQSALKAQETKILSGVNVFNEAQKRKQVAALYETYSSRAVSERVSAPGTTAESQQARATTQELQKQVNLNRANLALAGLTLEKDGSRYITAAKNVALQELDNKLLEIKNYWIGKAFDKEQNLAKIRSANLEYQAKLQQINAQINQKALADEQARLQAELAGYRQREQSLNLSVRRTEVEVGVEAALNKQIDYVQAVGAERRNALAVEEELALKEARRNGTLKETALLYEEKRLYLENEIYIEDKILRQKREQLRVERELQSQRESTQFAQTMSSLQMPGYKSNLEQLLIQQAQTREAVLAPYLEKLNTAQTRFYNTTKSTPTEEVNKYKKDVADATDAVNKLSEALATVQAAEITWEKNRSGIELMHDSVNGVGTAIRDGLGQALILALNQTENLTEAMQNLAASIITSISQMLILNSIKAGISALAGPDNVGFFSILSGAFKGAATGAYWPGGFQAFADGGMVTRPTMGLVGEGGEAEYIIPASKMRGAMARYASGARGSAVIPSGGDTGGDMGGIAVGTGGAIDVRYTVERINSVDYVTADQFQRGMAQAASQGASQGEQRALKALQNNRSTRSRLGLR